MDGDDPRCPICLCEMKRGEKDRCITLCGHEFHTSCLCTAARYIGTCPICRAEVGEKLLKAGGEREGEGRDGEEREGEEREGDEAGERRVQTSSVLVEMRNMIQRMEEREEGDLLLVSRRRRDILDRMGGGVEWREQRVQRSLPTFPPFSSLLTEHRIDTRRVRLRLRPGTEGEGGGRGRVDVEVAGGEASP